MVKSIARLILGFIAGTVLYVVGFFAGGTLIGLANVFAILPTSINRFQWALTAMELTVIATAANIFGIWIFDKIDKNCLHRIAFSIWLIIVASIYFTMVVLNGEAHLIWYSIIGLAENGFVIFRTANGIGQGYTDVFLFGTKKRAQIYLVEASKMITSMRNDTKLFQTPPNWEIGEDILGVCCFLAASFLNDSAAPFEIGRLYESERTGGAVSVNDAYIAFRDFAIGAQDEFGGTSSLMYALASEMGRMINCEPNETVLADYIATYINRCEKRRLT